MIPCGLCNQGAPFTGPYDITRQCRYCWLAHNNPTYKDWLRPVCSSKIKSLVLALYRHAKTWFAKVNQVEYKRRLSICRSCPHYKKINNTELCNKCGCGLAGALLEKPRWKSEHCPENKW